MQLVLDNSNPDWHIHPTCCCGHVTWLKVKRYKSLWTNYLSTETLILSAFSIRRV
jgi:hypothetical protein